MPAGLINDSHFIWLFSPIDYNGATPTEAVWNMTRYNVCTVYLVLGVNSAGSAITVDLRSAEDEGLTGVADLDVIEYWYDIQHATAIVTNDIETPTIHRQTADARITCTNNVQQSVWFQFLADDLPVNHEWVTIVVSGPGAVAKIMYGFAILKEPRYSGELASVLAVGGTATGLMPAAQT